MLKGESARRSRTLWIGDGQAKEGTTGVGLWRSS